MFEFGIVRSISALLNFFHLPQYMVKSFLSCGTCQETEIHQLCSFAIYLRKCFWSDSVQFRRGSKEKNQELQNPIEKINKKIIAFTNNIQS